MPQAEQPEPREAPITWVQRVANLHAELGREPTLQELLMLYKQHVITPEEREALRRELAELEAANERAPAWGAAVGARAERIRNIRETLGEGTNA